MLSPDIARCFQEAESPPVKNHWSLWSLGNYPPGGSYNVTKEHVFSAHCNVNWCPIQWGSVATWSPEPFQIWVDPFLTQTNPWCCCFQSVISVLLKLWFPKAPPLNSGTSHKQLREVPLFSQCLPQCTTGQCSNFGTELFKFPSLTLVSLSRIVSWSPSSRGRSWVPTDANENLLLE